MFLRLYKYYNMIGHMAHKIWVLVYAREFTRKHIKVQSIGRMFPSKLNYILFRRSLITLQIKVKNFIKRKRDVRKRIDFMLSALEGHSVAANVIRKNWRIKMFNKQMSTFIFICAIYWRTIDDEKDWRIVQLQVNQ